MYQSSCNWQAVLNDFLYCPIVILITVMINCHSFFIHELIVCSTLESLSYLDFDWCSHLFYVFREPKTCCKTLLQPSTSKIAWNVQAKIEGY